MLISVYRVQCVIVLFVCLLLLVQEERRAQLPRYQRSIPPRPGPAVAATAPPTVPVGVLPPQQPPLRHPMHGQYAAPPQGMPAFMPAYGQVPQYQGMSRY